MREKEGDMQEETYVTKPERVRTQPLHTLYQLS